MVTKNILASDRFVSQQGFRIIVQVPDQYSQKIIDEISNVVALKYGDYERVSFKTTPGFQQFKSTGNGRNAATKEVIEVPCAEISFFLDDDKHDCVNVLKAIYFSHPYEEPVVFVQQCTRTLHIKGMDEDNPNRFWNNPPEDWVPKDHR